MKQKSIFLSLFFIFIFSIIFSTSGAVIGAEGDQPGNTTNESFNKSKKLLERVVYKESEHRIDIYCGCQYDEKKEVNFASCGYKPQKDYKRAHRIEWEHVVPAEAFGQSFSEWREGHPDCVDNKGKSFKGRKCAEKVNQTYRLMQADMYNLYPAIGEVNRLRSNYSMAMIPGSNYRFWECRTKIEDRKIEPRPEVRGEVARTYMYMDRAYPGRGIISGKNEKLFQAWDKADPVDKWECERASRIAEIQGNINLIVDQACRALQK
ncbi:MAG: endonuclease [Syntrophales bacterium]|jgi:deoxyribonuclease-1